MNPVELQPHELMQRMADFCESEGIAYRVVGSMASMAYGEPRFTNDVDIAIELTMDKLAMLCEAFPTPEYYLSASAAREAVERRVQFNILHPASGLKVAVIVPPDTEFARSEAGRVKRISSAGEYSAWFASPEDVLLKKLVYYRASGGVSDKHLRDIAGMMKLQGEKLDRLYIGEWAAKLDVAAEWDTVRQRVDEAKP
jgi:hypothetical protein